MTASQDTIFLYPHQNKYICGAITCTVKQGGCLEPYPQPATTPLHTNNIVVTPGSATSYIAASKTVEIGYDDTVCLECVTVTAGTKFRKDNWHVIQKRDCTADLTAASPAAIILPFDSSITPAVIFTAYGTSGTSTAAYTSASPVTDTSAPTFNKCPITTCTITLGACPSTDATSTWSEVSLLTITASSTAVYADAPWQMTLAQTAAAGYAETSFCYSCSNYQQTAVESTVKVSQIVDCSKIYDAVTPLF